MERPTIDLTKFYQAVDVQGKVSEHRKAHPTTKSDELYYDLMARYFRRIAKAVEEGEPLVGCGMGAPAEIFEAMNVTQMSHDIVSAGVFPLAESIEECHAAAAKLGIREEICSSHRLPLGIYAKGWVPRSTVIVYVGIEHCDNMCKSGQVEAALYNVPSFFVDSTYYLGTEKAIQYMAKEYEDLIRFLEEQLNRKFDWDKFKEALKLTMRQVELAKEIRILQRAKPCPIKGMEAFRARWIRMMWEGTEEIVQYYETLVAELRERVKQGKGVVPEEKYRLINLFTTPLVHQKKLFDFLEKEHGATIVAEPMYFQYGDLEMDLSKPLEAMARRHYNEPYFRYYCMMPVALDMIVKDAVEAEVDAGINWFNSKCRFGGPAASVIKDTLREKVGIPTLNVDIDILDPSPRVAETIIKRLDDFLKLVVGK